MNGLVKITVEILGDKEMMKSIERLKMEFENGSQAEQLHLLCHRMIDRLEQE